MPRSGNEIELHMHNETFLILLLRHTVSWHDQSSSKVGRKWKWSNGVRKGEIDPFWCISITNNVESYKNLMKGLTQPTLKTFKIEDPSPLQSQLIQILVPRKSWFLGSFLEKILVLTDFGQIIYILLESFGSQLSDRITQDLDFLTCWPSDFV